MLNENCRYEQIGYERLEKVIDVIGGKWKLRILYVVGFHHVIRYNELKRQLDPITHNMLSRQLKDLERDGLIIRTEHPQVPPKVEYSLNKKGLDLLPVFDVLCNWIDVYLD